MIMQGLINREYVHTVIRKRPQNVHKGDCGRVLILAGSREMAGAAVLASRAAIRCGSGLVKVCTEKKIFPVLQASVPEVTCTQWAKTKNDLQRYDCIAVGPGMGVGKKTEGILERILRDFDKTIVIDADGLNALAASEKLKASLKKTRASVIITPHIGEASRLLAGRNLKDLSKLEIAQLLYESYGCITVVKGAETLVAISGDVAYTNTTGNPGMATAGSGDVLTGIITSLAGQGLASEDAARAGVFVHGLAGDLAAEKLGEYGLVAGDIADNIPFALKELSV